MQSSIQHQNRLLYDNGLTESHNKFLSTSTLSINIIITKLFFVFLGTTWLQEIVWLLMNNNDSGEAYQKNVWDRVPLIEQVLPDRNPGIDVVENMASPRIFKSHLPPWSLEKQIKESGCKTIYIDRNPKDSLVSYYYFLKMIYPDELTNFPLCFELFRSGNMNLGDWFDHVIEWSKNRGSDHFLFTNYEDMKSDINLQVDRFAKFLNTRSDREFLDSIIQKTSFKHMKENPKTNLEDCKLFIGEGSTFVRKGLVGDWKNYFTVEQNEFMDKVIAQRLTGTGLKYRYT